MSSPERICYLCAEPIAADDLTVEHVFPESLFNPGDRVGLIKLPAHKSCNGSYSKDDEYFRLCMTAAAYKNPSARKLWDGPVLRGFHRPQSAKHKQNVLAHVHDVEVTTPAGVYLGQAGMMAQQADRLQRVVNRMARGLHTHLTDDILPADWSASCVLMPASTRTSGWSTLYSGVQEIGNGTIRYAVKRLEEDPREAFYWLVFYDTVDFFAFTGTTIEQAMSKVFEKAEQ